jgi:hypothetical protein
LSKAEEKFCRSVIDDRGTISVYDTAHHRIFGVARLKHKSNAHVPGQDRPVEVADLSKTPVYPGADHDPARPIPEPSLPSVIGVSSHL